MHPLRALVGTPERWGVLQARSTEEISIFKKNENQGQIPEKRLAPRKKDVRLYSNPGMVCHFFACVNTLISKVGQPTAPISANGNRIWVPATPRYLPTWPRGVGEGQVARLGEVKGSGGTLEKKRQFQARKRQTRPFLRICPDFAKLAMIRSGDA